LIRGIVRFAARFTDRFIARFVALFCRFSTAITGAALERVGTIFFITSLSKNLLSGTT
jgi:hypothetical protein